MMVSTGTSQAVASNMTWIDGEIVDPEADNFLASKELKKNYCMAMGQTSGQVKTVFCDHQTLMTVCQFDCDNIYTGEFGTKLNYTSMYLTLHFWDIWAHE